MLHYYRTNPGMRIELRLFLLLLVVTGAFVAAALYGTATIRGDVVIYEGVCHQLSANTTVGRQALVSSVWWAPLAFLLRWPVASVAGPGGVPIASFLVSALFGAACLFMVERVLRALRLGWCRVLLVFGIAMYEPFFRACTDGSSNTTVLFFVLLIAHSLAEWVASRKVRCLVRFGYAAALLCGLGLDMAGWLVLVLLLLGVDLLLHVRRPAERQATLIVALLPALYGIGLWLLLNWLIMGDGLYCVRSLFTGASMAMAGRGVQVDVCGADTVVAAVALAVAVVSLLHRCRPATYLALMALAPYVLAHLLRSVGLLWDRGPVLFTLFPLTALSIGYAAARAGGVLGKLRSPLALIPLLASALHWYQIAGVEPQPAAGTVVAEQWDAIPSQITRHVLAKSRYPRVMVCGYDGFILLRNSHASNVFVHALDFDFERVENDFAGDDLFILVRRPVGRGAMDSIHWKFEGMYHMGDRTALIDSDWGDWRLFEMIQAPKG